MTEWLRPGLLLAMPASPDPYLSRAVVLVTSRSVRGSSGLVVNQPSAVKVAEVLHSMNIAWQGGDADLVWRGGRVAPQQMYLVYGADTPAPGTTPLTARIVLATTPEGLRVLAEQPPARIRFVLGIFDWKPGQLEVALADGGVYTDATPELVFDTAPNVMWDRVHAVGIQPPAVAAGFGAQLRQLLRRATSIPRATLRRK